MDFINTLNRLKSGEISVAEVVNDILDKTQKEPNRINLFIKEIDAYIFMREKLTKWQLPTFLFKVFNEKLTIENTKSLELSNWKRNTIILCEKNGYKSINDIPKDFLKFIEIFSEIINEIKEFEYGNDKFGFYEEQILEPFDSSKAINQIKENLLKYIEPNQETQSPQIKKQAKGVWGLLTRYEFLNELGVISKLNSLNETQKVNAISQILGCNEDNAKKLKNGTYPTSEKEDEQMERKHLISLIKPNQTR